MDYIDWLKQIEKLQEEKINLICENDKLKNENEKLKKQQCSQTQICCFKK